MNFSSLYEEESPVIAEITNCGQQNRDATARYLCKVGGSLLDWEELPSRLSRFLNQLNRPVMLLAGGGKIANLVRDWDQLFNLGEERSHQLAIESMSLTASLLTAIVPQSCLVKNQEQLEAAIKHRQIPVLDAAGWLEQLEAKAQLKLPHTWNITSDSIALWLAAELGLERLVLLKSIDFPDQGDLKTASEKGLIDAGFPDLFKKIAGNQQRIVLNWHNLRSHSGLITEIE